MDGLLSQNKKIYGNLSKIVTSQVKKEVVCADQHKSERDYMRKMSERQREMDKVSVEKTNMKIAQKIASA